MLRTRISLGFVILSLLCLPAYGEDEEGVPTTKTIDLRRYQVPPAPPGSRLPVPSDMAAREDADDAGIWSLDWSEDSRTWLPFEEPSRETQALPLDAVAAMVRSAIAHRAGLAEAIEVEVTEERLVLSGPREAVEAAAIPVDWILAGLAPSLRVDAVLTGAPVGAEPRLRAMGGVHLWPGRWTRVYLQENGLPCTPRWDLEVAQESVTMDPNPVNVAEGRELYLRYHPGETVSVVEVWSGDVEHLELLRDDLSRLRNIPEANGLGVVSYPRSAVNRAFTQLLLPIGETSRREIRWTNEGRAMRLALRFEAASAVSPVLERGARNGLVMLRAGASSNGLEFGARERSTDEWNERMSKQLYGAAEAYEARGRAFEFSVSPVDGGSIFLVEAPVAELGKARTLLARTEARMATATVHLQVWTVPEPAWRAVVLAGQARVGQAVAADVRQALVEAGAATGESFTSPSLVGTPLGFRVGHCRPGIIDYDAELAQQAAGLHPVTSARFHGLYGELRIRTATTGLAVRVRGAYCTAQSEPKGVEIAIRPPVSMKGGGEPRVSRDGNHLVSLPVLTGSHAAISREVAVRRGAEPVLVHAHVRGEEVIVVLVNVLK